MVVRNCWLFIFALFPFFLFAGEFTASVNRNQVNVGEIFTLSLTLKGASAKEAPSTGLLQRSFLIHSQQQASNTSIVNGQVSSSMTWKLVLIPQLEGSIEIPSISIVTSDGTLISKPITILVIKGSASAGSNAAGTNEVTLTTEVSHQSPYKNEPFIYTVRLISQQDLANIKVQKLNIEDAIVETHGETKIDEQIIDGISKRVIEFSYLITPLKAGPLKIPSNMIQGGILKRRSSYGGSFFDEDFDLFSMMQGFDRLKPFALATEELSLDVQPAIVGMVSWLPARSLKIEEIFDDSKPLQEGEAFTRTLKIVAEGVKSSQLPSLNDLQANNRFFKIYADKPELGDDVKNNVITSYRKEQFTLIPQQSGELTLPEISVAWWDVLKKEMSFARIPSRTLPVLPASENKGKNQITSTDNDTMTTDEPQPIVIQRDPILYIVIAGLAILLMAVVVWGVRLQKKIARLTETSVSLASSEKRDKHPQQPQPSLKEKQTSPVSDKKEKLPNLNPT